MPKVSFRHSLARHRDFVVRKVAKHPNHKTTMPDTYSIETIEDALKSTGWNLARVKLLARFLLALIVCRTVCP